VEVGVVVLRVLDLEVGTMGTSMLILVYILT